MTYKLHQSRLRTIHQGEQGFMLQDELLRSPRAGFHILSECPREYKLIISECIDRGWLQPVATVYDHELTWDRLSS